MIEIVSAPSADPMRLVLHRLDRRGAITFEDTLDCGVSRLERLRTVGLLVPGETRRDVPCDQCERGCWVTPRVARVAGGRALVAPCTQGWGGLIRFPTGRLATWNVDPAVLAHALTVQLGLVGMIEERVPGRVWWLGERRADRRRDVYLVAGLGELPSGEVDEPVLRAVTGLAPVVLVPVGAPEGLADTVIPLLGLVTSSTRGIEVDVERFEGRLKPLPAKRPRIVPFLLPLDARWDEISVEFLDDERAALRCRGREEVRTYIELGFLDARSKPTAPRPNELWRYLRMFADEGGRITWQTASASPVLRDRMRELRLRLLALFPIEDGKPIADYSERKAYETTFTIRRRAA